MQRILLDKDFVERKYFVTNSSSSSYVMFGIIIDRSALLTKVGLDPDTWEEDDWELAQHISNIFGPGLDVRSLDYDDPNDVVVFTEAARIHLSDGEREFRTKEEMTADEETRDRFLKRFNIDAEKGWVFFGPEYS